MQGKKTKAKWVGLEPQDKHMRTSLQSSLSKLHCQIPSRCEKGLCRLPSDRLCVLFLYHEEKVNQRSRGIDIIIFQESAPLGDMRYHESHVL